MLVVSTARALVYNYLPAPYLPAGSLPDRRVRCPTEPSKRQMEMEMGGILETMQMEMVGGGAPPPPPVCVCPSPRLRNFHTSAPADRLGRRRCLPCWRRPEHG